ncbi:hypothetical protein PENSPDRAFT_651440 [Peniophora sp. CONT]|nr:hypothetical protein PENSPDRAFT_651440 [Peniophora sp. CONT]
MASVLPKFTRSVDGTIPVPALLYHDEETYAEQDSVGIYDGTQKAPNHQNGTVFVTSHRLFYVDSVKAHSRSFSLDLAHVVRTDYYAGLFTSSSKVTLHLSMSASGPSLDSAGESWVCEVCNYRNPPGASLSSAKCTLCGVPRAKTGLSSSTVPSPAPRIGQNAQSASASVTPAHTPGPDAQTESACPACTFLNHPSLRECEICGTGLPRAPAKSAPVSRPESPPLEEASDTSGESMMKLSFRKGGDKILYAALRRSLLGKAWEVRQATATAQSSAELSGIGGLMRSAESNAQTRQDSMEGALADLETLMIKARDMIRLSAELNERLTAMSSVAPATDTLAAPAVSSSTHASAYAPGTLIPGGQAEDATFVRSSLIQLGLHMENTPVTLDMIRDEKRWHEELARELAGVLQGDGRRAGLMRTRGIIGIDEVWGGWNRARGVALIPPETFLQVLPHLATYSNPPISVRKFSSSGLTVLHSPAYAPIGFVPRLQGLIAENGSRTTLEVAWAEDIPVALAAEMIGEAEVSGDVCRDEAPGVDVAGLGSEGAGEIRWWLNIFHGYEWDGQE